MIGPQNEHDRSNTMESNCKVHCCRLVLCALIAYSLRCSQHRYASNSTNIQGTHDSHLHNPELLSDLVKISVLWCRTFSCALTDGSRGALAARMLVLLLLHVQKLRARNVPVVRSFTSTYSRGWPAACSVKSWDAI